MQLGPYLARIEEDDLAELKVRIVSTKGIFDDHQFSWILGLAGYFA